MTRPSASFIRIEEIRSNASGLEKTLSAIRNYDVYDDRDFAKLVLYLRMEMRFSFPEIGELANESGQTAELWAAQKQLPDNDTRKAVKAGGLRRLQAPTVH